MTSTLSNNEKKVYEHIRKNPGCSKQHIVRGMAGNPTRITVLDVITDLEKKHLIKTRKDKPNSQIYRIFTSSETVVGESLNNLHEMKEALLNLLTTIQQNHIKLEAGRKKFFKEGQLRNY